MVHSCVCRCMCSGFDLWIPARRMAVWFGRSGLVDCGAAAMVADENAKSSSQTNLKDIHKDLALQAKTGASYYNDSADLN